MSSTAPDRRQAILLWQEGNAVGGSRSRETSAPAQSRSLTTSATDVIIFPADVIRACDANVGSVAHRLAETGWQPILRCSRRTGLASSARDRGGRPPGVESRV